MRANFVGRSFVSAMTQTPASGPFVLVTTPAMSLASMAIASEVCAETGCVIVRAAPRATANTTAASAAVILIPAPFGANSTRSSARELSHGRVTLAPVTEGRQLLVFFGIAFAYTWTWAAVMI